MKTRAFRFFLAPYCIPRDNEAAIRNLSIDVNEVLDTLTKQNSAFTDI